MNKNSDEIVASTWTPERVKAAVDLVVGRVRADVGSVAGADAETVVAVRFDPHWELGPASGLDDMDPAAAIGVVLGGRHEFPLGLDDGVEYACLNLANQVQDDVVGELHRPWPELRDPAGTFLGVLEPMLTEGIAGWAVRGRPFCSVGQLTSAVAAAGLVLT